MSATHTWRLLLALLVWEQPPRLFRPSEARLVFAGSESDRLDEVYLLITSPPPPLSIYWNHDFSGKCRKNPRAAIIYGQNVPFKGLTGDWPRNIFFVLRGKILDSLELGAEDGIASA